MSEGKSFLLIIFTAAILWSSFEWELFQVQFHAFLSRIYFVHWAHHHLFPLCVQCDIEKEGMIRTISCEAKKKETRKSLTLIFYLQFFQFFPSPSAMLLQQFHILLVVIEYFHSSATVCCNNKKHYYPMIWEQASERRMRRKEIFMITLIRKYNYDYMRPFGRFMTLLTYMCVLSFHLFNPQKHQHGLLHIGTLWRSITLWECVKNETSTPSGGIFTILLLLLEDHFT